TASRRSRLSTARFGSMKIVPTGLTTSPSATTWRSSGGSVAPTSLRWRFALGTAARICPRPRRSACRLRLKLRARVLTTARIETRASRPRFPAAPMHPNQIDHHGQDFSPHRARTMHTRYMFERTSHDALPLVLLIDDDLVRS